MHLQPARLAPPRLVISFVVVCALTAVAGADHLSAFDTPRERQLAVATDPIGLFSGKYALSATYVLTQRFALRADVQILEDQSGFGGSSGWRAAISVPIFLDRSLHGPYLEPGVALAERLVGYSTIGGGAGGLGGGTGLGEPGGGTLGGVGPTAYSAIPMHERSIEPQIFVGWQWLFDSGLHLAAAVGVSRHFASDGSGTSTAIPESYVRVGIAL
jgi:hypothetical protein